MVNAIEKTEDKQLSTLLPVEVGEFFFFSDSSIYFKKKKKKPGYQKGQVNLRKLLQSADLTVSKRGKLRVSTVGKK